MPDTCAAVAITPESKLGDVLARWPELETVLLELSPHFRALQNPILRRTVAKLATLRQVSQVSGVGLGLLVGRLREAAGLAPVAVGEAEVEAAPRPSWATAAAVTRSHDARAAIAAGQHPLEAVMRALAELGPGEVYELVTPFVPAPLVERARAKGFDAWSAVTAPEEARTFFIRG